MSEYNKFLSYFNKNKKADEENDISDREDIIPVKGAVRNSTEEPAEKTEEKTEEITEEIKEAVTDTEEISLPEKTEADEKDEISTDTIKNSRISRATTAPSAITAIWVARPDCRTASINRNGICGKTPATSPRKPITTGAITPTPRIRPMI